MFLAQLRRITRDSDPRSDAHHGLGPAPGERAEAGSSALPRRPDDMPAPEHLTRSSTPVAASGALCFAAPTGTWFPTRASVARFWPASRTYG